MVGSAFDMSMIRGLNMKDNETIAISLLILSGFLICLAAYLSIGIIGLLIAASACTFALSTVFFLRMI